MAASAAAYPRSHGATPRTTSSTRAATGLSPLARGNLTVKPAPLLKLGPIPARTGQPACFASSHCGQWAYPRSHGATSGRGAKQVGRGGLSPLARGNQDETDKRRSAAGPIPARTGQPLTLGGHALLGGAYPRSHGATRPLAKPISRSAGLSPLARGNLALPSNRAFLNGPIPARTGQPP